MLVRKSNLTMKRTIYILLIVTLSLANIPYTYAKGCPELFNSVTKGDYDTVKKLIDNGCDVNSKDGNDNTALMFAALSGQANIVKLLIDNGADDYYTLLLALQNKHFSVAKLLIDNGVDVNTQENCTVMTALQYAVWWDHTETIKLLIEKGADVNATDESGNSALMYAASKHNTDTVRLLLEKGAAPNPDDYNGATALMGAASWWEEKSETLANLNKQKLDEATHLDLLFGAGHVTIDTVKLLIEHGAEINAKDKYGRTALMIASMYGHPDTVKLLIESGADIRATDLNGKTALIKAVEIGRIHHVTLLIEKKVDINRYDDSGSTPLDYAKEKGRDKIIKLLLESGAKDSDDKEQRFLKAQKRRLKEEREAFETEMKYLEKNEGKPKNRYETASDGQFIKYSNGIVYDKSTGLEWYAGPDEDMTWYRAKVWVELLSIDGGNWRMPSIEELKTLYKKVDGKTIMTLLLKDKGAWIWSAEMMDSWSSWCCFIDGRKQSRARSNSLLKRGFALRSHTEPSANGSQKKTGD